MLSEDIINSLDYRGFIQLQEFLAPSLVDEVHELLQAAMHATPESDDSLIIEKERLISKNKALRNTPLFKQIRSLANELAGQKVWYSFDHAIFKPAVAGAIDWHQDQVYKKSLIQMRSLHFWIPLEDVPLDSGAMEYLPGSHATGLQAHFRRPGSNYLAQIVPASFKKEAIACPCRKGDVLIHHPLTVHRSRPNTLQTTRKAWIVHFSPYGRMDLLFPQNLLFNFKSRLFGHSSKSDKASY